MVNRIARILLIIILNYNIIKRFLNADVYGTGYHVTER